MPIEFPIADLPIDMAEEDAIEAAYGDDLDWIAGKLRRGVSVLVEGSPLPPTQRLGVPFCPPPPPLRG